MDLYIAADIEASASRHQENWLQDNAKCELSGKSNYRNNVISFAAIKFKYKFDTNIRRILRSCYQQPFARECKLLYAIIIFIQDIISRYK